jgi:hypothetical protein
VPDNAAYWSGARRGEMRGGPGTGQLCATPAQRTVGLSGFFQLIGRRRCRRRVLGYGEQRLGLLPASVGISLPPCAHPKSHLAGDFALLADWRGTYRPNGPARRLREARSALQ